MFSWLFRNGTLHPQKEDSGDYRRAALDVVVDDLHVGSVWPGDPSEEIEAMQRTIDSARAWITTVSDQRARDAYFGWVDLYQGRVDKARENLSTHAYEKNMERIDREFTERRQRAKLSHPRCRDRHGKKEL